MTIRTVIIFFCFSCFATTHHTSLFGQVQAYRSKGNDRLLIPSLKDTVQVVVDSHKMSMYVSGTGKYTVILEAGGNHRCWSKIDTQLAKIARVISYDRPGYLKSEMCNKQRDATTIAKELKQALHLAGYPPPYILVGWSLGSAYVRTFCGLYPESVAGMVLIDPTPEEFYSRAQKEYPELMVEDSIYLKEVYASTNRPGERAEIIAFDTSMNQARISDTKHAIPTSLLIAAYGKLPGPGEKDPNNPINRIWKEELVKWAGKRPNLRYAVINNSGHHIAWEHPEIVVKAIIAMIDEIK